LSVADSVTGVTVTPLFASPGWSLTIKMASENETNYCTDTKASPTTHFAIGIVIVTKVRVDDSKGNSLKDDQYEKTERGDNVTHRSEVGHAAKDENPDPDNERQGECRHAYPRGLITPPRSLVVSNFVGQFVLRSQPYSPFRSPEEAESTYRWNVSQSLGTNSIVASTNLQSIMVDENKTQGKSGRE
jgi:hypothetical protein